MMSKRRAEDDENEAPSAKARKSNQASKSKQSRNGVEGGRQSQVAKVERFGASAFTHYRQTGAGQIKTVKVTNFMCHSNMKVEFNEHVNFISGPNGSGKSAILQALQYCLGVRATQTGRAQTNAAYLKKGEEVCTAEVTLWNTGSEEDTFEPGQYGPTITIHKTLSSKGSTTTKVLDHKGNKTDLTKADDVRRLLAKLSVNAANPSIVLTQDHARGLLTGQRVNHSLYSLLEESLNYTSTFTYLNAARVDIKEQKEEVANHREARKETEAKLQDISDRLDAAEHAALHNQVAEDLEDHKAWAVVRHIRKKIAELDESLKDGPERQKQYEKALEEKEQELRDLEAKTAQLGEMEDEIKRKGDEVNAAREELRLKRKDAMGKKNKIAKQMNSKQHQIQSAEGTKSEAEQEIEAVKARGDDQESIDKQMAEWHAAYTRATEMVQASQHAAQQQRKQAEDVDAALNDAQETFELARKECQDLRSKVQQATNELHSMQRSSGPHQEAMTFDNQAGRLLDAIDKNRQRFRKPVLGPVGACLALDPTADQYSATICAALKHQLPSWIVDSREDLNTLLAIAKRDGMREPKALIMRYDLEPHTDRMRKDQLPPDSIKTVLNVLRIKPGVEYGHVVMNVLIDHCSIERVGLAENEDVGQRILNNSSLWSNLQKLLCNAPGGPVEMVNRGSNSNVYPWQQQAPEPLLSADKSRVIAARQTHVEVASHNLQEKIATEQELRREFAAKEQEKAAAQQEMRKLQEQIKRAKHEEQRVSSQRPEVRASAVDELSEWFEQIDNAQAEILRLTPELNDLTEQYDQAKAELEAANEKNKDHQELKANHQQELLKQLEQVQDAEAKKGRVQIVKDQLLKKMEKIDTNRQEDLKVRTGFEEVLAKCVEDAETTCTEEEAERERPALEEKIMALAGEYIERKYGSLDNVLDDKDLLQQMVKIFQSKAAKLKERAKGTVDELSTEKTTLEKKDGANRTQTGHYEALVKSEHESWMVRKEKFYQIRNDVDNAISKKFKDMLRTGRGWRGRIDVDHDSREVLLSVTPHKGASTEGAAAVKDMKSLSGGERSFTSVSFVLSLGQEISTPFFAMDEFDVFMDAVNRKVALTSILKFAWELKGTQFILLSPLDMSVVEQSRGEVNDDLKVQAGGVKCEEMPREFIKSVVMAPPREGAKAHF